MLLGDENLQRGKLEIENYIFVVEIWSDYYEHRTYIIHSKIRLMQ